MSDKPQETELVFDEPDWEEELSQGIIDSHYVGGMEIRVEPSDEVALANIIKIFSSQVSDAELRNQIPDIQTNLPSYIKQLRGVKQTRPHGNIDAFDHTFNTFAYLDTSDLDPDERLIVRLTMLLHDVAKAGRSHGQDHPRSSAQIAYLVLANSDLKPNIKDTIVRQVAYHDFLGDLSRKDHRGVFCPQQMTEYFKDARDLKLHRKIVMADVASIPGLRTYLPNIEDTYTKLFSNLHRFEWRFKTPEEGGDISDVTKIDRIIDKVITHERDFDEIDIYKDCSDRQARFESLTAAEQNTLEKYIIEASRSYHDNFLRAMQATGQEMNTTYVDHLEEKYGTRLDELRISTLVFRATYASWRVNYYIRNESHWESRIKEITILLADIARVARQLTPETVFATHCTPAETEDSIVESGELYSSAGDQFEGDGVYVGLMGSYRMWGGYEHMYSFPAKMADMFPVIVDFNYPKMMGNVLCQYLDIFSYKRAIPQGVIWRHEKFDDLDVTPQKIRLLQQALDGAEITQKVDSRGLTTYVIDTGEAPIVWGSLARALGFPKVIAKVDLTHQQPESFPRQTQLGFSSIRIHGISSRELKQTL